MNNLYYFLNTVTACATITLLLEVLIRLAPIQGFSSIIYKLLGALAIALLSSILFHNLVRGRKE